MTIQSACKLSPWTRAGYLDEMARLDSVVTVAEDQSGIIVGFLAGRFYAPPGPMGGEAELNNIGVLPSQQSRGIGSELLRDFLAKVRAKGVRIVTLEVRPSNAVAREFYSRRGFIEAGARKAFYRDPVEDGLVMRLRLKESGP